jgi:hypothetical protein
MPVLVVIHRLKDFDEWIKLFNSNPPPKVGQWRLTRGIDDRNRVHVVAQVEASDVKNVKEFIESERMRDVFRRVNAMSTQPMEFVWLEDVAP